MLLHFHFVPFSLSFDLLLSPPPHHHHHRLRPGVNIRAESVTYFVYCSPFYLLLLLILFLLLLLLLLLLLPLIFFSLSLSSYLFLVV